LLQFLTPRNKFSLKMSKTEQISGPIQRYLSAQVSSTQNWGKEFLWSRPPRRRGTPLFCGSMYPTWAVIQNGNLPPTVQHLVRLVDLILEPAMLLFWRMGESDIFVKGRARFYWLKIKDAVRGFVGGAMNALHSPARLHPFEYVDPDTDETTYLYTDRNLSVLCVGDRRFYFDRITGKFDGVSSSAERVSGWIEL
jgi:hypothetical protein